MTLAKKVNIFFVPCYLNGADGIFNLTFYQGLNRVRFYQSSQVITNHGATLLLRVLAFANSYFTTSLSGFGFMVRNEGGIFQGGYNNYRTKQI